MNFKDKMITLLASVMIVNFANILKDILHTFLIACGCTFLFLYFYDKDYPKEIAAAVFSAMLVLMRFGMRIAYNHWFNLDVYECIVKREPPIGKAVKVENLSDEVIEKEDMSEDEQKIKENSNNGFL